MNTRTRSLISLLLVAIALCFPSHRIARADVPEDARLLFERGVEASRYERWQEARSLFERSLKMVAKPSTLLNLAIVEIKLGHGEEALKRLDAFQQAASPKQHASMLARSQVLRAQAQALVDSARAKAQTGGNSLSQARVSLDKEAQREVAAAREHYAHGRDHEALAAFERAYRASKRPELLYNIGVVADRMRDDERAVLAYDAFTAALPDAPEAAVAQLRSAALHGALDERARLRAAANAQASAKPPEPGQPPRDAPPPVPAPYLTGPRTLTVSGVVLTAASIGVLGWYFERSAAYRRCIAGESPTDVCATQVTIAREKRATLGATVTLATVGLTTTTIGAVWLARRKRSARGRTAVALTPALAANADGALLGVHGRF